MGFLKDIGSWLGSNALGLLGFGSGLAQQHQNINLMREQNEFNASQASINRNFQAQQAQLARDYQTEFYEQYQSPGAMVRQYQDAGLNPALMTGGYSSGSPVSSSSPSGSMAAGGSAPYQSIDSMVNMVAQMAMIKANIENTKADTDLKLASAFNQERSGLAQNAASALAYQQIRFSKKDMSQIDANIEFLRQRSISEVQQRNLRVLEMAFHKANNKQMNLKNAISDEFERLTGHKADSQTINAILFSASNVLGGITDIIGSTFNGLTSLIKPKQDKLKIPKLAEVTGNVK